jgi:hypothetical protein
VLSLEGWVAAPPLVDFRLREAGIPCPPSAHCELPGFLARVFPRGIDLARDYCRLNQLQTIAEITAAIEVVEGVRARCLTISQLPIIRIPVGASITPELLDISGFGSAGWTAIRRHLAEHDGLVVGGLLIEDDSPGTSVWIFRSHCLAHTVIDRRKPGRLSTLLQRYIKEAF